jgi:serpin B
MAIFFSCEKNWEPDQPGKKININKTTADMVKADNAFGLELFQEVLTLDDAAKNVFISPVSVALALAMTYNGADGDTKTAMENVLKKNGFTLDEINEGYKSLMDALVSIDPKVLLEIANSIWYRKGYDVLPQFIDVNKEFYDALVYPLDFNKPNAPDAINNWVKDKTHGKIREIIRQIPAETVMYLINAIYFKGSWQYEFDKEQTDDDEFYPDDGSSVMVPFMQQQGTFRYGTNELFSMVEMAYGQGDFSMLVLLPNANHTTNEIVDSFTPENWNGWIEGLTEKTMEIHLPKFTYEYKNLLNDELTALGMGVAFADTADFSKINSTDKLFISKVLHKSFVEVNEEGTEAAAVTSVEISLTAFPGPEPLQFFVDHPFLFAIREKNTGTILFIGRVRNPLVKSND